MAITTNAASTHPGRPTGLDAPLLDVSPDGAAAGPTDSMALDARHPGMQWCRRHARGCAQRRDGEDRQERSHRAGQPESGGDADPPDSEQQPDSERGAGEPADQCSNRDIRSVGDAIADVIGQASAGGHDDEEDHQHTGHGPRPAGRQHLPLVPRHVVVVARRIPTLRPGCRRWRGATARRAPG